MINAENAMMITEKVMQKYKEEAKKAALEDLEDYLNLIEQNIISASHRGERNIQFWINLYEKKERHLFLKIRTYYFIECETLIYEELRKNGFFIRKNEHNQYTTISWAQSFRREEENKIVSKPKFWKKLWSKLLGK